MDCDSLGKRLDNIVLWLCTASPEERQAISRKLLKNNTPNQDTKPDEPSQQAPKNNALKVISNDPKVIKKTRTIKRHTKTSNTRNRTELKIHHGGLYQTPVATKIDDDDILTLEGKDWLKKERACKSVTPE